MNDKFLNLEGADTLIKLIKDELSELDFKLQSNYYKKSETDRLLNNKVDNSRISNVALTGNYSDLKSKPIIPSKVSELVNDKNYVTQSLIHEPDLTNYYTKSDIDARLANKQNSISDLDTIRSGAARGATAIQTESDPNVPNWAKADNKPSYAYSEISNTPDLSLYATTSVVNNLCPIIEDGRSSAVTAITGVAPFATLVDGQRLILHTNYTMQNNSTLNLTLSGGNTTGEITLWNSYKNGFKGTVWGTIYPNIYLEFVFDGTNNKWVMLGQKDTDTTYVSIGDGHINDKSSLAGVISGKTLRGNFYTKTESDNEFVHISGQDTATCSWTVGADIPSSAVTEFEVALVNYDAENMADEDVYEAVSEISSLFPSGGTTPVITVPLSIYKALMTVAIDFDSNYDAMWEPVNVTFYRSLDGLATKKELDTAIGNIETLLAGI